MMRRGIFLFALAFSAFALSALALSALAFSAWAFSAWAFSAAAAETAGTAQVIDGETLRIGKREFVLMGIDAPEPGQTCLNRKGQPFDCHRIAATGLMDLVAGARVACRETGKLRGERPVAVCRAGDYDLSEGMTYTGWALADPETGGAYRRFEATARKKKHGLWAGAFEKPWVWRRANK